MIIEQVVGNIDNISDETLNKLHLENVFVESSNLVKKVQRVVTDHGREIGICLNQQKDLSPGDILYMDEHDIIVLNVIPDDLLIIRPNSLRQMGDIAHKIGNRHIPAQFDEIEMLVQYDYLVEELLQQLEVPYTRENKKVKLAFRHVGHSHG